MTKIDTILFDFDGTLADTNHLIAQSYLHVLAKYLPGEYTTEESVRAFNGPSLDEVFTSLNPQKAKEMIAEYRTYNHAKHDELIKTFPNVSETLAKLKKENYKLAVVSTKKTALLHHGLEFLKIKDYFDTILGGSDFKKVKPDPESLNLAMERMSSFPNKTIMVGDNPQDIEAGNRANVRSVFVEWSAKPLREVMPYNPHKTVKSMLELETWLLNQNTEG